MEYNINNKPTATVDDIIKFTLTFISKLSEEEQEHVYELLILNKDEEAFDYLTIKMKLINENLH